MSFSLKPLNIPITAENKFSSIFKTLKSDVMGSTLSVGNFNTKLKKSSESLAQKGQQLKKTGSSMVSVGKSFSLGLTAPIVALGTVGVASFAKLEKGMKSVASLSVGSERIKTLTKDVDEMSVTYAKSTDIMTAGLYETVSAFGDMNKIGDDTTSKLKINSEAAAAGQATVLESVKLTSAVTKAYGDTTNKAVQSVADMAFKTVELGQTTYPELAASITKVTSKASELGIQQKGLFGIMATATGVTGNAAEVTTQLNGVMTALMTPTKAMTGLYKKLGVEGGKELIKKTGGIAQAMKLIVDNAKESKTPLQSFIGSQEGVGLALALTGKQYDNLISKTKAMGTAQGSSGKAFKVQSESFVFKTAKMKQEFLSASRGLGEVLVPVLIDVMKKITPMIQAFRDMSPETKKIIVATLGLAAVLGPVIVGLGFVISAIGSIVTGISVVLPVVSTVVGVFSSFGTVLAMIPALFNPITIAVGLFTGAFVGSIFLFKKFFTGIQNSKIAPQWIKNFANDWLLGLERMKEAFSKFGSFVGGIFKGIWEGIKAGIEFHLNVLLTTINKISSIVPDWIKESVGIDLKPEQKGTQNSVKSEELTKIQMDNYMTKKIIEQQNVNVNFSNTPEGTTIENDGGTSANLNMGSVQ